MTSNNKPDTSTLIQPGSALTMKILSRCSVSKARTSLLCLPHCKDIRLPVFMPVGTQGTLKGLTPDQLYDLDCQIILGNTYHLDSGGFQMVSLSKLSKVTEQGVEFISPHNKTKMLLTPEKSIQLQNVIGADIIMQLDDVISSTSRDENRIEEAMYRSIRWLDRCIKAHKNKNQNLFPIIQGGLNESLRKICLEGICVLCFLEMIQRDAPGYAIGGLSGGESKDIFWRIVSLCTDKLPEHKPRYCMGVGYAEDLVVCVALGVDMFDCVFPTRTARFGTALTMNGPISLKKTKYMLDTDPIEEECKCYTCLNYSRAFLCSIVTKDTIGCQLLTIHNIAFQLRLMSKMQQSIKQDEFPLFVKDFMFNYYSKQKIYQYPTWITDALKSVKIDLKPLIYDQ